MKKEHVVALEDEGIRLDRWFKRHMPDVPHSMLQKYLRKGQVRLDGKKAQTSDRITAGQTISMPELALKPGGKPSKQKYVASEAEVAALKASVLYEDGQMIAINKPAGLAVQGGSKVKKSVDDMLPLLGEKGKKPKLTHRLDRDTSGVLLLAKDAQAAAHLTTQFAEKTIQKTYLALVHGTPTPHEGTINQKIEKMSHPASDIEFMMPSEAGKTAVTHWRVLESLAGKFALVELEPETGRTHQLRVHMQSLGCSIVGDPKYGGAIEEGALLDVQNRLHLHAWKITLRLPNGKQKTIAAPLPEHMRAAFSTLEITVPKP